MPKDNQATVHLSLQDFLKSIVDDEDFSIAFRTAAVQELRWPRLSEQIFRVDKWSLCQG